MSTKSLSPGSRLVWFISDFLTPWTVRHLEQPLRGVVVQLLGQIKEEIK